MLALLGTAKKKKKKKVLLDLSPPEEKRVHGPTSQTLVSLLCRLTDTLTTSQDSANVVFPSHSHHPRNSYLYVTRQPYQKGCAVCSRAHPRKKLFAHEDTNCKSQFPVSISLWEPNTWFGALLVNIFDLAIEVLRKTGDSESSNPWAISSK